MPLKSDTVKYYEDLLPEANKRKRRAAETVKTGGYKDFQEWVERNTKIYKPEIRDLNGLVSFCANALIGAGIQAAGAYFEQVQKDPERIKQELENLKGYEQNEASEWDVDDDHDLV